MHDLLDLLRTLGQMLQLRCDRGVARQEFLRHIALVADAVAHLVDETGDVLDALRHMLHDIREPRHLLTVAVKLLNDPLTQMRDDRAALDLMLEIRLLVQRVLRRETIHIAVTERTARELIEENCRQRLVGVQTCHLAERREACQCDAVEEICSCEFRCKSQAPQDAVVQHGADRRRLALCVCGVLILQRLDEVLPPHEEDLLARRNVTVEMEPLFRHVKLLQRADEVLLADVRGEGVAGKRVAECIHVGDMEMLHQHIGKGHRMSLCVGHRLHGAERRI